MVKLVNGSGKSVKEGSREANAASKVQSSGLSEESQLPAFSQWEVLSTVPEKLPPNFRLRFDDSNSGPEGLAALRDAYYSRHDSRLNLVAYWPEKGDGKVAVAHLLPSVAIVDDSTSNAPPKPSAVDPYIEESMSAPSVTGNIAPDSPGLNCLIGARRGYSVPWEKMEDINLTLTPNNVDTATLAKIMNLPGASGEEVLKTRLARLYKFDETLPVQAIVSQAKAIEQSRWKAALGLESEASSQQIDTAFGRYMMDQSHSTEVRPFVYVDRAADQLAAKVLGVSSPESLSHAQVDALLAERLASNQAAMMNLPAGTTWAESQRIAMARLNDLPDSASEGEIMLAQFLHGNDYPSVNPDCGS